MLARTDPDAPPHRGISYLIVDMRSPGIDVRPLVQMTGDAEFSEVYFEDVVVPRENVLGELNGGWPLAMHTLTNERGPVVLSHQVKLRVALDALAADATRFQRDGAAGDRRPAGAGESRACARRRRGAQLPRVPQRRRRDRARMRRASRRRSTSSR